jgi:rare lipoprotein A
VLRVTRVDTGAVVYVRVNDRGPFGKKRRILDLSEAAAASLDMLKRGIAEVLVEVVERGKAPSKKKKS